jgi:C1A family cysteine protease
MKATIILIIFQLVCLASAGPYNQLPHSFFNMKSLPYTALPEYFSWRDVPGVVRPIQYQGQCGSCFIFASIAAIEGQLSIHYGNHQKLSEQEMIDCLHDGNHFLGCKGGHYSDVFDFARQNGIASAYDYPYTGSQNQCRSQGLGVHGTRVSSYVQLPRDEESIRNALYKHGPLFISFQAPTGFDEHVGGIFTDYYGGCHANGKRDHTALLIGWGTENGHDYWIIKNSYGTWWGEAGFFKMTRGINLCGIADDVSYPILY